LYLYIYTALLEVHTNQKCFHLHCLAAQMQWYCRAIVCEELAQGPYTVTVSDEARNPRYRTSALTDRPLFHIIYSLAIPGWGIKHWESIILPGRGADNRNLLGDLAQPRVQLMGINSPLPALSYHLCLLLVDTGVVKCLSDIHKMPFFIFILLCMLVKLC